MNPMIQNPMEPFNLAQWLMDEYKINIDDLKSHRGGLYIDEIEELLKDVHEYYKDR